jgi:hypothetical protein
MAPRWRSVLREPLLHFVVLGTLLFALYGAVAGPSPESHRIVVEPGRAETLAATFQATWQRPPTPEELRGLIDSYVREEILYREAVALGLDRDDVIVRRRMAQKMELLASSFASGDPPGDDALEAWLRDHPERYRTEPRLWFQQVYLSPDRRGPALEADATHLLEKLRAGAPPDGAESAGDPISLPPELRDASLSDVARLFGEGFAARLAELPIGAWQGPVDSGYGIHLVRIEKRAAGRLPGLPEVRDAVLRDWRSDQEKQLQERFYQSLRQQYQVVIEAPIPAPDLAATQAPR